MDITEYLSSKTAATIKIDASTLHAFACKAASQMVGKGTPMNDSILGIAKEAHLNDEQIKRVVEQANHAAFATLLKTGFDKNVHFDVADADKVIKRLEPSMSKQASAPQHQDRSRYIPGQEGVTLEGMMGLEGGVEKTAGPARPSQHELARQYLDASSQLRQMVSQRESMADAIGEKLEDLDRLYKLASSAGNSAHAIGACIELGRPDENLMRLFTGRYAGLVEFGQMAKLAQEGVEVQPQNPITDLVGQIQQMQETFLSLQESIEQAQATLSGMLATLNTPKEESPADKLFQAKSPEAQAASAQAAQQRQVPSPVQAQQQQPQQAPAV